MARNDEDPFHAANAAALVVDDRATVLGCTRAAETLLGLPAAELCGRTLTSLFTDPFDWRDVVAHPGRPAWEKQVTARAGGADFSLTLAGLPLGWEGGGTGGRWLVLAVSRALMSRWREDYAFTEELSLQHRVGLTVFDPEMRVVRSNTPLLPYSGMPGDVTGMRLESFLRADDARHLEGLLREVLRTGTPVVGARTVVHTDADPGTGRVLALSVFRLQASDGHVLGANVLFTDVTEESRARRRLDLLHEATSVLGSSFSVPGTARDLAGVLVPELADAAAVDIAEAVFGHREPSPEAHGRHLLRRAATSGGEAVRPRTGGLFEIDVGRDESGGLWTRERPAAGATGAEEGVPGARSEMTAVLRARGMLLGRVCVWRTGTPDTAGAGGFDGHDRELLEEIVSRAALVMDNARRYERERRAAVSLQSSLLPPAVVDTDAVESASVYLPSEVSTGVSGDWFDVIPLSSARVALVVGDVVGHGLQAIATMGRLRTAVRTLADLELEPDELLTHLDDLVSQLTLEAGGEGARDGAGSPADHPFGATCLYLTYDPVTCVCLAASAGHPPPAVLDPDGEGDGGARYLDVSPGPPLGVGGLPFEPVETRVENGSVLALFTDGLVEHGSGDVDDGMTALLAGLRQARSRLRPLQDVGRDIVGALAPTRIPDDVTLLLARTRTIPADATAAWALEPDPRVVATARKAVAEQLSLWGLEDLTFTTELVASELVTNAIRHVGGPVELRLIRAATLVCEVSDPSNTQPRMRRAGGTEEGGRGLYLIAQLTARWGSRHTRHGKTIWTEQPLPPTAAG